MQNIKDQVAKYLAYWGKADIAGLMSMYGDNMKYHDMPSGEVIGYGDLQQFLTDTFALQEDQRIKLNQSTFIEGTTAFIYWTQSFVSRETSRRVKVNGVELIVFSGDMITSIHEFYEFQTIGSLLMPTPGVGSDIEKMTKLGLNNEILKQLVGELSDYLEQERPYLEPDLTLATVASYLGYTRNQISFVINHVLDKTFYDLINGHRINHVIDEMRRSGNSLSILELGFDAGFNSVSGYYNAFKKQTDKTPAQYLKHMKK